MKLLLVLLFLFLVPPTSGQDKYSTNVKLLISAPDNVKDQMRSYLGRETNLVDSGCIILSMDLATTAVIVAIVAGVFYIVETTCKYGPTLFKKSRYKIFTNSLFKKSKKALTTRTPKVVLLGDRCQALFHMSSSKKIPLS